MAGQLSGLADNIVSAVPVVNQVVPADAVTAVSVPIAGVAGGATTAVVDAVVPPVVDAVPVLEPVLQPVSDLVTGTVPLPVAVPDLPVVSVDAYPFEGATSDPTVGQAAAEDLGATFESPTRSGIPVTEAFEGQGLATSPVGAVALAGTSTALSAAVAASGGEAGQQDTAGPSPVPTLAPAAPGSGVGSGTSAGGSSGSAAWLSSFDFDLPLPGAVPAGETPEHVPAPVSFDPGSSPD
ncbi:hypothetical protein M1D93_06035 [Arthrobacter sp. Z1-9]